MPAPTFANLTKGSDTSNLTAYTTASVTITSGKPVLMAVANSHGTGTPATPTLTVPSGVTVQNAGAPIETELFSASTRRLSVFWLTGAGTGTITITVGQVLGANHNGCLWWLDEVTDASTSTPAAADSDKSSNTGTTATVNLGTVTSGNSVWAAVALSGTDTISAGTNYTEVSAEVTMTTPDVRLGAVYRSNHDDVTPEATLSGSAPWAMVAVEVAATGTTATVPASVIAAVAAVPDVSNITTDVLIVADIIVAVANIAVMGAETDTALSVSAIPTTAAVPDATTTANALVTPETIAARASVGTPVIGIRHTFFPPVVVDLPSVAHPSEPTQNRLNYRLFRHYGPRGARGKTVIKTGGTYSTIEYPTQDQLDAAEKVFLGGHVYDVDADTAAELVAAGYGSNLT